MANITLCLHMVNYHYPLVFFRTMYGIIPITSTKKTYVLKSKDTGLSSYKTFLYT